MKNKIKKLPNGDFKVEHRIDDPDGLSKQYPKIMKNPARFGFVWKQSCSNVKYVEARDKSS